ncbi:MAG: malectin domain-containing carbohydrate-binding protein [Candidatus Acidiferrales bacterium]
MESTIAKFEAERAELDSLLGSETFGRVSNLAKILSFICDKYFQGATDELKEYDIAVHALGRSKDFDPQIDTIVRVTAYALRKRLEQYYRTEGADHPVQICLPPGRYVPKFVRRTELSAEKFQLESRDGAEVADGNAAPAFSTSASEFQRARLDSELKVIEKATQERPESVASRPRLVSDRRFRIWTALAVALFSTSAIVAVAFFAWKRPHIAGFGAESAELSPPLPVDASGNSVRALVGDGRAPYVDRAGQSWSSDSSCSGGTTFSVPARAIQGTRDPQLFLGGRSGQFHCAFSLPAGIYEVHLLFAETTGLQETSRTVVYSLNGAPSTELDVVDDTGGDDIETEKVFVDVHPEQDGKIHLDFPSPESYLNAIEILPGIPKRMLPVRIYAGEAPYRGSDGQIWLPNRYFFGGRPSHLEVVDAAGAPDGALFSSQWIGHFHYVIPVAPGEKYTVKLHFLESWFGGQRGVDGGAGSRVFDVWCNGTVILNHFDIFRESGTAPLTKTFQHIEPTGQDKIQLDFMPERNYPSLNAIEVIPE